MADRSYPDRPVLGVGAVVLLGTRLVLVKRTQPPLSGEWNLPGGVVELGEPLNAACAREVLEETGLVVDVGPLIDVVERIEQDGDRVRYHFVIADYLCRARGGDLRSGSDAGDVALADPAALDAYRLTRQALEVIARGLVL